jgi:copper chaperone CopZ
MKRNLIVITLAPCVAGLLALTATRAEAGGCCAAPTLVAQAKTDQPAGKPGTKVCALNVDGMTCGACAAGVNAALKKLEGVKKSDIAFEKKGGTIEYDLAKVDEKKIVAAVEKAGFKATVRKEQPKVSQDK